MANVPKKGKKLPLRAILGVFAAALALVGFLFVGQSRATVTAKVPLVGVARAVKTGHALVAEDLKTIPSEIVPTGAIRDPKLIVGKLTRVDLKPDELVLDNQLVAPSTGTPAKLYFALAQGKVAVNIPATEISPYVQPGDLIDIVVTPHAAAGAPATATATAVTKIALKDIRVLAVGAPPAAGPGAAPAAATGGLIVEVDPKQAEALVFVIKNTDFSYVLRSPLDANTPEVSTDGIDLPRFKTLYQYPAQ